ncbi:MAG: hypothetical protein A3K19_32840 [Lentisphaerae bacterium RIFOXYB12_FULL_65_16]|nr:MAG: hypothetical protein A3K18_20340 [Lentisphaerae bacterium RIFOXYA12_64_32]OGV84531.1 MAG: hypothetical protein A3K19_32840 [Lentisphaerae bacterium RIFOXYB12_FULL_65_16]
MRLFSSIVAFSVGVCCADTALAGNAENTAVKEGFISVPGGKVWYRIVGADKKGTPLLTLHGGPGAPHDYLEPLEALADERPVVFYDQLGCGKSERPSDKSLWTAERFVEELVQVRSALGLERVHITGQSWGTMLAVDYMLTRKPTGVESLILSGPALSAPRFIADQQAYLEKMPETVRQTIRDCEARKDFASPQYQEAMMAYYRRHVCRLEPWPDCINRAFAGLGLEVYGHMWGPSEFTCTGTLANYDRTDRLKEIRIPVLFTCGEFDEATPATSAFYKSCLPGSELLVLKDASHMHPIEKPAEYLAAVRDFLRRAEATTATDPDPETVTVDSMVKVVFTGDSQTCGRGLAIDFPQLISRTFPVRVINTGVGGSNSDAQVLPMTGGKVRIKAGENVLYGENVSWGTGPFPGMKVTVNGETHTIDHIVEHPPKRNSELYLCEPARADYEGTDCAVEPGWHVRVASHRPDVVVVMYINDGEIPEPKRNNWREMLRRIRDMGAVPVLMSPFPVDDNAHGANHPGTNDRFAQNAAFVRAFAEEQKAWFVDVFNLTFALDAPLRCMVSDGIHPDTDGHTTIVNGLTWVFNQMGLANARPFIKGWALDDAPTDTTAPDATKARPFHTSQPDHPDPDHEVTAGFTLDAIRRNDEYGLIAKPDGDGVPLDKGLLFRCGLRNGATPERVVLRLTGTGLGTVRLWQPATERWANAESAVKDGWTETAVPAAVIHDGVFHVAVLPAAGEAPTLDAIEIKTPGAAPQVRWQPSPQPPSAYVLESDHARPNNLVRNAAFTQGGPGVADAWTFADGAAVNRPGKTALPELAILEERNRRVLQVKPGTAVAPRAFDLIVVQGSAAGNDGPYRVRQDLGNNRCLVRRIAKAAETGLHGELIHDDGCGRVPGGGCVEVAGAGSATTQVQIPAGTRELAVSFFYRVCDPPKIGTRDVPERLARVTFTCRDAAGTPLGAPVEVSDLPCSYQWQKATLRQPLPEKTATVDLALRSASAVAVQYTGVYVAPAQSGKP